MSASDTVIEQIHAYCLNRYNPSIDLPQLSPEKWNCKKIEALLRRGRPINPPTNILPGKLTRNLPLPCEHLNYETSFFFYLPKSYNPQRTFPLILIGHGGNGNMSQAYAKQVAFGYVQDWLPIADKYGFIIAAPLTEKGWANIGYSIFVFPSLENPKLVSHRSRSNLPDGPFDGRASFLAKCHGNRRSFWGGRADEWWL